MKVLWTAEAESDRAAILDYLQARDPAAALWIDRMFGEAVGRLAEFPLLGHIGDIVGTRELTPHRSYRIVYQVVHDTVSILVLMHSAREWPPLAE